MYKKIIMIVIVLMATICGIISLFVFNNKYNSFSDQSLSFLTKGQQFVDVLLEPDEINDSGVDVKVGQYQNLSAFHPQQDAFGKSTFVFEYTYQGKDSFLSLYIQEPFSVTYVYVNGELIAHNGSFSPYHEQISDIVVSFPAQKHNKIVIQTENRSHYYSGIQYPIAIGESPLITRLILQRVVIYCLFSFSSLAIALYSLVLWLKDRHQKAYYLHFDFGIFALCFGLYSLYPFFPLFHLPTHTLIYALQDSLIMMCLYMAYFIILRLTQSQQKMYHWMTIGCLSMVFITFVMPFILPYLGAFVPVYGWIISLYKIGIALYMLFISIKAYWQQKHKGLLLGTIVYTICLFVNVITMNKYEPASLAWIEEFGMFVLLLCFAGLMIQRSHQLWQEHQQLNYHLQEEVNRQTQQLSDLMEERQKLLSEMLHDLKKPISTAQTYLQLLQQKEIVTDQNLHKELQVLEDKYSMMNQQIYLLQTLNAQEELSLDFKVIDLNHFIEQFYQMYLPDAEVYDIFFQYELSPSKCMIMGDEQQLLRIFQNLFFNALAVSFPQSTIHIQLQSDDQSVKIVFEDNGKGIAKEHIEHIFERGYTTNETQDSNGLGLYIVKSIVTFHHGTINVISDNHQTRFTITLPLLKERI